MAHGRNKSHGINKFLQYERKAEDRHRQYAGKRDRNDNFDECAQTAAAVDHVIALLWQPTSPITYNAMLRVMPELKQKSIVEQARVFALLNMAASDAFIVGWRDKYLFLFWRPETAIRNADSDGNDATSADTTWQGSACP